MSRTLDDSRWIVVGGRSAGAACRATCTTGARGTVTKLFDHRPALAGMPLQPMHARRDPHPRRPDDGRPT
ncbi:MAG: hypothetical protein MZV49_12755 [Rhodopseudomonas palustris]|nr:hypothetical protein [Rhodopseudomonas palustris]